jgi:predicted RecA/RadA family phage recombinase
MASNYLQPGDTLTLTAPYAVVSGAGAKIGSIIGIATKAIANGATGEFAVTGVWSHAKVSAQAWTEGAKVYWDDAAKNFTTTSSGNTLAGVAVEAAGNPSATGKVRLNGSF